MCGENIPLGTPLDCVQGSSPRVRGKLPNRVHPTDLKGLIPAHAGKTYGCRTRGRRLRAHPRACGENFIVRICPALIRGSSPRMRGRLPIVAKGAAETGLIPAHAGKTSILSAAATSTRAHPRACGENRSQPSEISALTGSSPRMRGKQAADLEQSVGAGLIPAHAGKTLHRAG